MFGKSIFGGSSSSKSSPPNDKNDKGKQNKSWSPFGSTKVNKDENPDPKAKSAPKATPKPKAIPVKTKSTLGGSKSSKGKKGKGKKGKKGNSKGSGKKGSADPASASTNDPNLAVDEDAEYFEEEKEIDLQEESKKALEDGLNAVKDLDFSALKDTGTGFFGSILGRVSQAQENSEGAGLVETSNYWLDQAENLFFNLDDKELKDKEKMLRYYEKEEIQQEQVEQMLEDLGVHEDELILQAEAKKDPKNESGVRPGYKRYTPAEIDFLENQLKKIDAEIDDDGVIGVNAEMLKRRKVLLILI